MITYCYLEKMFDRNGIVLFKPGLAIHERNIRIDWKHAELALDLS